MSNQSNGRKKSQFLALTGIPADATFDFVSGGTNYKITAADLFAALGVTGTIVQDGAVTGTPVLNTAGTVNNIRNVEPGPGISSSVSSENGLAIEHNFQSGAGGVAVLIDIAEESPIIRSLLAGSGINIAAQNGALQITATGITTASNVVIINQMTDFPAAISGVRTLAADTQYLISADLTTADRFVMLNNTVLSGSDAINASLQYTGTSAMITAVDADTKIKDITLDCPNGDLLDISSTTGANFFQILNSTVTSCDTIGTLTGLFGVQLNQMVFSDVKTDGLLFSGAFGVVLIQNVLNIVNGGSMFDLGSATLDALSIDNNFNTLAAGTFFLSGLASSGNINAGGLGSVHDCRFFSSGTPLDTISVSDVRWQFFINDKILDTHKDSLLSLTSNATNTVIAAVNTPTLILGTWNLEHSAFFTQTAAGRSTYGGIKEIHVDISMSFSAEPVSGTNKLLGFYVAINGSVVSNSEATNNLSAGDPGRTTVIWRIAISPGDYIEAFVENESDATDILVSDAVIRIS